MAFKRISLSLLCDIRQLSIPARTLTALLSVFLSFTGIFGTIGWAQYQSGSLAFDDHLVSQLADALPFALLCSAALTALLATLFARLKKEDAASPAGGASPETNIPPVVMRLVGEFSHRPIVRCTLVILACWLPYLVIYAPGILTYDPLWSLTQCLGSGALPMISPLEETGSFSAHKPIVHTWILGGFLLAGDALGSQAAGIFVFVALQSICTAASLAAACCFMAKLNAPWKLRIASLAFCALFPFVPLYAISCLNDSMFSWLYILWFLCVIEVVRTRAAALFQTRFVALYAFLGIALSCTKNPGIYLVLATAILEALIYRRAIKAFAVAFFAPALVAFVVLPFAVYPAAGVVGSSSHEALGTFYQATAAYVLRHGDEVTADERKAIDAVLHYDELAETYDFSTQDPVKALQRTDAHSEDIIRYLITWLEMGMKHPATYAFAIGIVPMPFFCPAAEFTYYDDAAPKDIAYYLEDIPDEPAAQEAASRLDIQRNPSFDEGKRSFHEGLSAATAVPIIGWTFGLGFWASWLPLFAAIGVFASKRHLLPAFVPVALSLALLIISPWAMARYALPLVYTAPLLAALLFSRRTDLPASFDDKGRTQDTSKAI
ncbi:hypothetical protein B5F40_01335 [Gordonibacter sp. An230]|nr:hypothetical protein B5F40_01335 [Gordonibacter sp. An230]